MSTWLWHGLKKVELPIICLDARHARAALHADQQNRPQRWLWSGANCSNWWYGKVGVKASRTTRCVRYWEPALKLVGMRTDIRNQIRGLLKIFGVVLERHSDKSFEERVKEAARRNKGIWHDTPQLARC
jgi:hypothetical protein